MKITVTYYQQEFDIKYQRSDENVKAMVTAKGDFLYDTPFRVMESPKIGEPVPCKIFDYELNDQNIVSVEKETVIKNNGEKSLDDVIITSTDRRYHLSDAVFALNTWTADRIYID